LKVIFLGIVALENIKQQESYLLDEVVRYEQVHNTVRVNERQATLVVDQL
jgi:hypothetical protein